VCSSTAPGRVALTNMARVDCCMHIVAITQLKCFIQLEVRYQGQRRTCRGHVLCIALRLLDMTCGPEAVRVLSCIS
jgi:hypothetical protein